MGLDADQRARVIAVVAATVISLACGTNYVYSAWAPQFAKRLHLSATSTNLIGTSANLGMYAAGIPTGIMIDRRGHKPGLIIGTFALGVGYYPLKWAYDHGPDSLSVPVLCFFSLLTGIGSCCAFQAAIKVSALNFPTHRGTATGLPLAAFGLSAFFFSFIGSLAFHGDTSGFLLLLSLGTPLLVVVSYYFMRVIPHPGTYTAVPTSDGTDSRRQSVAKTGDDGVGHSLAYESEEETYASTHNLRSHAESHEAMLDDDVEDSESVVSKAPTHASNIDIRGFKLLPLASFWELFCLLSLLAGTGLMTINNIGANAHSLWRHWDDTVDDHFIEQHQSRLVSILSLLSCFGRLASGVSSDIIVRRLRLSRLWNVVLAGVVFFIGQASALQSENPNGLYVLSTFTGLGYGILFGVFPTMTAETFGINGLSQNWGTMTLAPTLSGNIFNIFYGVVADKNSVINDEGHRTCDLGVKCYRSAYIITTCSSLAGVALALFAIWRRRREARLALNPTS